jgi:hypothetical protein
VTVPDPEPEPDEMDLCSCENNMKVADEPWCPSCTEHHEQMMAYANNIITSRKPERVFCSGCNNRHEPDRCPFRY